MTTKECTVTATAVHDFRVKFPPELGSGLCQDPGEPDEASEFQVPRREVLRLQSFFTADPALNDSEVVPADCRNKKGGFRRRNTLVTVVFDKVKKLSWLAADFF